MKVQNIVVTEKYTDKQGQEKKAYKNIGKLFTFDDGGQSIKIEMMPVGAWDGNASVYDIKPREQHGQQQTSYQPQQNVPPAQQQTQSQPQQNGQYQHQQVQGRPPIEVSNETIPF